MQRPKSLVALTRLLAPDDEALHARVELAIADPTDYVRSHRQELRSRGIAEVTPLLPWLALIDGLIARGQIIELDWKEAPADVFAAIDRLLDQRPLEPEAWGTPVTESLKPKVWRQSLWRATVLPLYLGARWDALRARLAKRTATTEAVLRAIGAHLEEHQLRLHQLDFGSDSHAVIVTQPRVAQEAGALASAAGYGGFVRVSDHAHAPYQPVTPYVTPTPLRKRIAALSAAVETDPLTTLRAVAEIVRDAPLAPEAHVLAAAALVALGRHAEAVATASRAIACGATDASIYALRGRAHAALGATAFAAADAERARRLVRASKKR